jgi:hypothetical protein
MTAMKQDRISFSAAVEGPVDEAVLRQVVEHAGGILGAVYGKNGKAFLLERLRSYNHAARFLPPWVVLIDLDRDEDCAPPALARWLPDPAPYICFRIAVREVESWLLADREALADVLAVALSRVPPNPEALDDPKAMMGSLARHSRRRRIQTDMVPRPTSGRPVGAAYTSRLIEFAQGAWRPAIAAQHADSLGRVGRRLTELIETLGK